MRVLRALWMRLLRLLGATRADGDFDSELASHIELHTEDGVRAGLSREEARRQAMIRLGGAEQMRQTYRERRTLPSIEAALRDVRSALRKLSSAPGFACAAV